MNLADHGRRVGVLKAVLDLVTAEYAKARKAAESAFVENGIKGGVVVALPDGTELGGLTVKQPGVSVSVDDEALLAWVAEHQPDEVEEYLDSAALLDEEAIAWAREHRDDLVQRRVRGVWRKELLKRVADAGGFAVDPETGESARVAEVTTNKPTGAFMYTPDREACELVLEALRKNELGGVTTLSIAAPEEPEDGAA